ncbi:MAG: sigma-70 family RNA polymerase sigma factor [Syntrophomonas sp.]|uniref:RNA polymerase sigma factor n=1 Tax=Syntrophomonas sp. TaxID=2053627 RepID=UPI0026238562|nr:sigma-70 family RNA polymerase sigma factor [Syntrophomonas sp.]MDD2509744.1 sigma-70 family RNA polymerase sigma factor [Syntrophomonas sp.]MDD4626376.1 sigma-70 family RNA polymerase sigma factor [Syntrophomonas sp.]
MISDELLAEQALLGNIAAFEELVNRYKKSVFAIVYRITGHYQDAEDISQEVFFTLFEKLYQFDRQKKFSPWLHRIAVNTSISALRKKKNIINLNFDESFVSISFNKQSHFDTGDPQLFMEREELRKEIGTAIMQLPESYRTVIALRYQMEFNNQEIADILGVSKDNIEVKVHRARMALRKRILNNRKERGII